MAISFVNVATNSSATDVTDFTVTKPAGVQAGDILFAYVSRQHATNGFTLSGWTELGEQGQADLETHRMVVYCKVADAGDPATWTGDLVTTNDLYGCTCVAYRGAADPTGWVAGTDFAFNTSATNGTSYTSASLTISSGQWVLGMITAGRFTGFNSTWNVPANYSERAELDVIDGSDIGVDQQVLDSNGNALTGSQSITFTTPGDAENGSTFIGRLQEAVIPGPNPMGRMVIC